MSTYVDTDAETRYTIYAGISFACNSIVFVLAFIYTMILFNTKMGGKGFLEYGMNMLPYIILLFVCIFVNQIWLGLSLFFHNEKSNIFFSRTAAFVAYIVFTIFATILSIVIMVYIFSRWPDSRIELGFILITIFCALPVSIMLSILSIKAKM